MSDYGKRIAELREKAGLDQAKLAFRCKWKRTRITNYETGFRTPGVDELKIIAEALEPFLGKHLAVYLMEGVYLEDLLDGYKPPVFTKDMAVRIFEESLTTMLNYGRVQLEPGFKASDWVELFSKECGAHLGDSGDDLQAEQL